MSAHTMLAHAKINLVLEVGGRRDDGYHEIDTILQEVELADRVTVSWGVFEGVRVTGRYAAGTPADESNLAWQAAARLADRCGRPLDGLGIELDKSIPAAGGLGGGASDASAVLRLLSSQWDAGEAVLIEAANAVGSDEAFFLTGGTARARGRGERVEPLPPLPPHDVVLFIPPDSLDRKTGRLFAALDALPAEPMMAAARFALESPAVFTSAEVCNSFERVARDMFPGVADLWADIERRCGTAVHLAGAGPTLFWIGAPGAGGAVAKLAKGAACDTVVTRTAGRPRRTGA